MGKTLQVRGTVQVVDLRTLNVEIGEIIKEDIEEIDKRSIKQLVLSGGVVDQEINFLDAGITTAKFVYVKADNPVSIKFNTVVGTLPVPTTFLMQRGELNKIFVSTSVGTSIKVIALA